MGSKGFSRSRVSALDMQTEKQQHGGAPREAFRPQSQNQTARQDLKSRLRDWQKWGLLLYLWRVLIAQAVAKPSDSQAGGGQGWEPQVWPPIPL